MMHIESNYYYPLIQTLFVKDSSSRLLGIRNVIPSVSEEPSPPFGGRAHRR